MNSKYTDLVILDDEVKSATTVYECKRCGCTFGLDVITIADYCPCCGRSVFDITTLEEEQEEERKRMEEEACYKNDIDSAWNDAKRD